MERLLFSAEVAAKTGLPKKFILDCCEKEPDKIPKFFILHQLRRWKESDVEEWMEQNRTK